MKYKVGRWQEIEREGKGYNLKIHCDYSGNTITIERADIPEFIEKLIALQLETEKEKK